MRKPMASYATNRSSKRSCMPLLTCFPIHALADMPCCVLFFPAAVPPKKADPTAVAAQLKELIAARAPKVAADEVFAPTLAYVAGLCAALQVGFVPGLRGTHGCRVYAWVCACMGSSSQGCADVCGCSSACD